MTILKPDSTNALWNQILIGLGILLLLSAMYLVWLYTQVMNLNHALSEMRAEFHNLQTANSELKDKTFALFSEAQLKTFAQSHQLVLDRKPQYLSYASQP